LTIADKRLAGKDGRERETKKKGGLGVISLEVVKRGRGDFVLKNAYT